MGARNLREVRIGRIHTEYRIPEGLQHSDDEGLLEATLPSSRPLGHLGWGTEGKGFGRECFVHPLGDQENDIVVGHCSFKQVNRIEPPCAVSVKHRLKVRRARLAGECRRDFATASVGLPS